MMQGLFSALGSQVTSIIKPAPVLPVGLADTIQVCSCDLKHGASPQPLEIGISRKPRCWHLIHDILCCAGLVCAAR